MATSINLQDNLIGRFYFKQTDNGNLIGEYSHNTSEFISTESAERVSETDGFVGEYQTSWLSDDGAIASTLTIQQSDRSNRIFTLRWVYEGGFFIGEGFLVDGMLIGDYRDFEIE